MKIELQAGAFARALLLAAAVIPRGKQRAGLPIHLFAAEGIHLQCTDPTGIGTIRCRLSGAVPEAGEAAAAADRLAALVESFAPEATVAIATDGPVAKIGCRRSYSRLAAIPVDRLPTAFAIDHETGKVEISAEDCLRLLEPIAAVGREETRYYLNGIFLQSIADRLISVATDGLRLIRTSIVAREFSVDRSCIVPAPAVVALRKLLAQIESERILIRRSQRLIEFSAPEFCFVSRLIDATYPDYQRIIPEPSPNTASCSRSELLSALTRMRAAATVETHLAAVQWGGGAGQLDLFLARQPLDGSDRIDATTKGAAQVAVPIGQLAGMIEEFSCERTSIETADKQPIVLRDDGGKLGLIARATWDFSTMEVAAAVA